MYTKDSNKLEEIDDNYEEQMQENIIEKLLDKINKYIYQTDVLTNYSTYHMNKIKIELQRYGGLTKQKNNEIN